jgi:DNA-binding response OmpR family regulator
VLVLIVEDDSALAEGLKQALAAEGHQGLAVANALAGLDLLRDRPVDLILLDINLPGGLSGYAACEAYRSLRPRLPIIFITGAFTSEADARLAEHVGASGFLRKPFTMERLFVAAAQALEAARAAPPPLFAFDCEECGAESRIRPQVGDVRRVRCPNCGAIRVVKMEELRPIPEARAPLTPPTLRHRILVVDSAEHFRLYLLDLLTEAGHYVVTARDGQEALLLAQEWQPDLMITDILLPGMDGIALCHHIKAHPRLSRMPVITITGLRSEEYRSLGQQAGVDLFMSKPIRAEELFEKVHALIARASR